MSEDGVSPEAAFAALGHEARIGAIEQLHAEGPCSFSTLFEASGVETSAGFAYHLRQMAGQFVRQRDDERWALTAAGREAAQAVAAGEFTRETAGASVSLPEPCPLCGATALTLSVSDGAGTVTCEECDGAVTRLSVPVRVDARDGLALATALDTYHRNRIRTVTDGVCPDCGGCTEAAPAVVETDGDDEPQVAQFTWSCSRCGAGVDCQPTLAVRDHPAVVSFYDDHGEDVTDRPVWNLGPEWREQVLSTDPWCVLVRTRLDDELLELYVGGDGAVHGHRRWTEDADTPGEGVDTAADGSDDAAV